jgi:hypothetical protein
MGVRNNHSRVLPREKPVVALLHAVGFLSNFKRGRVNNIYLTMYILLAQGVCEFTALS